MRTRLEILIITDSLPKSYFYTGFLRLNWILQLYFIYSLSRKDVRLPVQLQRAMAAEAEAAREARAKVTNTAMIQ